MSQNEGLFLTMIKYFTSCSSAFVVNFEHVIDGWVGKKLHLRCLNGL